VSTRLLNINVLIGKLEESQRLLFKSKSDLNYPLKSSEFIRDEKGSLVAQTSFFNLVGHMGILPLSVREEVLQRHRNKDDGLKDFLDIFNSRSLSFLFELENRFRISGSALDFKSQHNLNHKNLVFVLLALIGFADLGLDSCKNSNLPLYIYFSGFFSSKIRNKENLQQMLEYLLDVPIQIQTFAQRWVGIGEIFQGKISKSANSGSSLGVDTVLGKKIKMSQRQVTINIGPLGKRKFMEFLPGGIWHKKIEEIVRVYWKNSVSITIRLIKQGGSITPVLIGKSANASRLGLDSWLITRNLTKDRDDCNYGLMVEGSAH